MMKYLYTLTLLLSISFTAVAQDAIKVFGKAKFIDKESVNGTIRDSRGKIATCMKFYTNLNDLKFSTKHGTIRVKKWSKYYSVYISPLESNIYISQKGMKSLNLNFKSIGIKRLRSRRVWQIHLNGSDPDPASKVLAKKSSTKPASRTQRKYKPKITSNSNSQVKIVKKQPPKLRKDAVKLIINSTPKDAVKYIDGIVRGKGNSFMVNPGEHTIRISKEGYTVSIAKFKIVSNTSLNVKLTKPQPTAVRIVSKPAGANIFIDNLFQGKTNKSLITNSGVHLLRLILDGYPNIEEEIEIKPNQRNHFTFDFNKIKTGFLIVKATPRNTKVHVAGKAYKANTKIKLPKGKQTVTFTHDKYDERTEVIEILENKIVSRVINLKKSTNNSNKKSVSKFPELNLTKQDYDFLKKDNKATLDFYNLNFSDEDKVTQNKKKEEKFENPKEKTSKPQKASTQPVATSNTNRNFIDMVNVTGGRFQMGCNDGDSDESPMHTVMISSFKMSKHEISNSQYCKFLNTIKANGNISRWIMLEKSKIKLTNGVYAPDQGFENHPVIFVSYYGAMAFCQWIGGRLPYEAEWEYAAVGGEHGAKTKYSGSPNINDVAWYHKNSPQQTREVMKKIPNMLGIFDMSGNVWEWCYDGYDRNYYKNSESYNPRGPKDKENKVIRGGSWQSFPYYTRVTARNQSNPSTQNNSTGFRVVMDVDQASR